MTSGTLITLPPNYVSPTKDLKIDNELGVNIYNVPPTKDLKIDNELGDNIYNVPPTKDLKIDELGDNIYNVPPTKDLIINLNFPTNQRLQIKVLKVSFNCAIIRELYKVNFNCI